MKQKDLKIDFRYLTGNIACLSVDSISGESVHNDINNEEAIIIFNSLVGEKADCQTVKSLLKENQELKKELEKNKNPLKGIFAQVNDDMLLRNCGAMQSEIDTYKTQQQEFIKYLEDKIYSIEPKGTGINFNCEYDSEEDYVMAMQEQSRLNTLKEILQKYKEITGEK